MTYTIIHLANLFLYFERVWIQNPLYFFSHLSKCIFSIVVSQESPGSGISGWEWLYKVCGIAKQGINWFSLIIV